MFPQSIETAAVKDYLLSLINPLNILNTDTGTDNVEINEANGVAIFTDPVTTSANFIIQNSLITADSYIEPILSYTGAGSPSLAYYTTTSGTITLHVENSSVSDTDNPITVSFRIIA